jgi:DNA-binding response OmpR family regulator
MIRILVIDDSEVIRSLLTDFLTDLGYAVDTAVDGLEGIAKALDHDYTVVICDVHMPKRNGFLAFGEISARKPKVNFIMTDSLPGELAEKARQAGVQYLLTKPFDLDELKSTLDAILRPVKSV